MKLSDFQPPTQDDERIKTRLERLKARTGLTNADLDVLVAKVDARAFIASLQQTHPTTPK